MSRPVREPESDGIYPRCVWCNGENYAPAVIAYSRGETPCASVRNCGKYLPQNYIKLVSLFDNEGTPDHPDITDERS